MRQFEISIQERKQYAPYKVWWEYVKTHYSKAGFTMDRVVYEKYNSKTRNIVFTQED